MFDLIILLFLAFLGAFFTSWVIGANSASPSFGPVTSTGVIGIFRSTLIVGIFAFLGAIIQGGSVADTIGKGLVSGVKFDLALASVILITASILILGGIVLKYPMPSAFTLVGSVIGTGLGVGGKLNIAKASEITIFWLFIPVIAITISYFTSKLLRRYVEGEGIDKIKYMLLLLGAYTAFTAGANQSGLVIGPLIDALDIKLLYLLLFAGIGMLIGAWTGSPKIIQAVSREYSMLGPRRATAALLSASLIAQTATFLGIPVSFNESIISSVIGSGLVTGSGGVSKRKMLFTVIAWVGALVSSTFITYMLVKYSPL